MSLRWGFLGASRIGRSALGPAVQMAPGHVLQAVAARDADRAAAYAAELGALRSFGSYAALLADPDIDLIYNALPNDAHAPLTIRALEAGKHVLCEKPLCMNAAEVRAMQVAEQRSGKRVMEAFCHVFHPQVARVQALLAEDRIGRLLAVHALFGNTLEWEGDFRWAGALGGGALLDLGCYAVSLIRDLVDREPIRVSAAQENRGDVDATMSALLDFGDGLAGQFTCSFTSAKAQYMTLLGTRGTIQLDFPFSTRARETTLTCGDLVERFGAFQPYVGMVTHFGRAVAGEVPMTRGLDWSLAQARVLDALLLAGRTGATVSLD